MNDKALVETVEPATLPADWADQVQTSREIGSDWLNSNRSPLLRVPSALVPRTSNVLLNPLHPDAGYVNVVTAWLYPFDRRIKL